MFNAVLLVLLSESCLRMYKSQRVGSSIDGVTVETSRWTCITFEFDELRLTLHNRLSTGIASRDSSLPRPILRLNSSPLPRSLSDRALLTVASLVRLFSLFIRRKILALTETKVQLPYTLRPSVPLKCRGEQWHAWH